MDRVGIIEHSWGSELEISTITDWQIAFSELRLQAFQSLMESHDCLNRSPSAQVLVQHTVGDGTEEGGDEGMFYTWAMAWCTDKECLSVDAGTQLVLDEGEV